jgi:hypothetical protein
MHLHPLAAGPCVCLCVDARVYSRVGTRTAPVRLCLASCPSMASHPRPTTHASAAPPPSPSAPFAVRRRQLRLDDVALVEGLHHPQRQVELVVGGQLRRGGVARRACHHSYRRIFFFLQSAASMMEERLPARNLRAVAPAHSIDSKQRDIARARSPHNTHVFGRACGIQRLAKRLDWVPKRRWKHLRCNARAERDGRRSASAGRSTPGSQPARLRAFPLTVSSASRAFGSKYLSLVVFCMVVTLRAAAE